MISMPRFPAPLALIALLSACAPAPRDAHEMLDGVAWMQNAAEYRAAAIQSYSLAERMMIQGLADPKWTAAVEQLGTDFSNKPPAVILDLDETLIDNAPFEAELVLRRAAYQPSLWSEWVDRADAEVLPRAAEFLAAAKARGVAVFFVTNRNVKEEPKTVENLRKKAVDVDPNGENVLSRGERPGWGADKSSRRLEIASRYRILLLLGDDLGDFISGKPNDSFDDRKARAEAHRGYWGERWIILPNPLYGSWERVLSRGANDAETLRNKFNALKGFK